MSNKLDDKTDNCQINVKKVSKSLICNICEDVFNSRQAKWAHEKKCNINKGNCEVDDLKEQLKQKDKQLEEFKIQILDLIKKSCKIHPKTLQKINNTLNNNSNNTVNNTYIVQFGREKLYEVFTKKEQIDVLNCGNLCLENLIEKAHFNAKYPQFKNILITNLQNNLAYKYNAETNNFDVLTKKELLEDIISERMFDIEEFFNNYKDDITPKMQMVIENFIKKMDTESYEDIKKQNIKIILYNNRSLVDKANIII
jgi:predicted transcriptional regulator